MKYRDLVRGHSAAQDRIDKMMNSPNGLPEYNEKAHEAIRKVLGYLPDKETLQTQGEYMVRAVICTMERKNEWDQEALDNMIKCLFHPRHEYEWNEEIRTFN